MKALYTLIGVIVAFTLLSFSVQGATDIGFCGSLSADTIYAMNQSITDHSGTCFTAGGNNATLDCNGYTIDGQGTGYGVDVNSYDNFTLTGCEITDFNKGVYIRGNSDYNIIQYTNSSHCEHCIEIQNSRHTNITDSSSYYSDVGDATGLYLGNSLYLYVSNVTLVGASGTGSFGDGMKIFNTDNSTLTNIVTDDNYYGMEIITSDYITLTHSDISNNRFGGIDTVGAVNLILTNTKTNNNVEDGLHINGMHNGYFYNITSTGNTDDGVQVEINNDNNTFEDINSSYNSFFGINFDGAGNTGNSINNSFFCGNNVDIRDGDSNFGDDNICNTTNNWNDDGTTGCTYFCGQTIPTTIGYCGTLSGSTPYVMNQSITGFSGDHCFWVTDISGVTFDCQGYTIDGTDSDSAFYMSNSTNIQIDNCIITDWQNAIMMFGGSSDVDITNVSASSNTRAFNSNTATDITIDSSSCTDNTETCMVVQDTNSSSYSNIVSTNDVANCISMYQVSSHNTFTSIDCIGSSIYAESCSNITFNSIERSGGSPDIFQNDDNFRFNGYDVHNTNDHGVDFSNVYDFIVNDFNVSYNADEGIKLLGVVNSTFTDGIVDGNVDDNIQFSSKGRNLTFDNISIVNSGDYGFYTSSGGCDDCNVTNSLFMGNTDDALYWRNSSDGFITNINFINNSDTGLFVTSGSHGNTVDNINVVNTPTFYGARVSTSDNNSFSNIHIDGALNYGFSMTTSGQTGNSLIDSTIINSGRENLQTSSLCPAMKIENVTGDSNKPIVYHNSTSPYSLSDTDNIAQLWLCYGDVTLDNVTLIGNDNNGLIISLSDSVTITDSSFTDYYSTSLVNIQSIDVTDTIFTSNQTRGVITISNTTFNFTGVTSSNPVTYGLSLSVDSFGEVWNSNLYGNSSALRMTNHAGNTSIDVYNSDIDRGQSGSDSGALRMYCSYYDPSSGYYCNDTNIANLYNVTLEDYSVTNSSLTLYWYLSVANILGADVIVKDAFGSTISSFSDTTKQLTLIQYIVAPVDNQTDHTPHTIEATKTDYNPLTPQSLDMNQNRFYNVSLTSITPTPTPPSAGIVAAQSGLAILVLVMAFVAVLYILFAVDKGISIRELIYTVIGAVFIIIAIAVIVSISAGL